MGAFCYFRQTPPDELLNRLVQLIGFIDLTDSKLLRFRRFSSDPNPLLAEYSSYFRPCYHKSRFPSPFTFMNYITILKIGLRASGRDLKSIERRNHGKSVLCFQIENTIDQTKSNVTNFSVSFV